MGEIYQVIFNTRGSNVINNTNLNAVQYNVNWASFLPDKYKKFRCQFAFKSVRATSALADLGYVNIDFGRGNNIYDGLTMSSNLGVIYPECLTTTTSYFTASIADNREFPFSGQTRFPTDNKKTCPRHVSDKTFVFPKKTRQTTMKLLIPRQS
jgi:hypothetical protein